MTGVRDTATATGRTDTVGNPPDTADRTGATATDRTRTGAGRTATVPAPDTGDSRLRDTTDTDTHRDTDTDRDTDARRDADRGADNRDADETGAAGPTEVVPVAPAGPRPRASLLATLGLIVSVAGAGFVLAGALAGYGIALGAIGAVLAVLGLIASRRRHVTGKADGLLGVGIGLAAVVLGVLAMTGQFGWPTADGDWVLRLREWLDSQFEELF